MQQAQNNNNPKTALQQRYLMMIQVIFHFCGIFTTPIEYALRPAFGTRYFEPILLGFTWLLMMLLPLASGATPHLPFGRSEPPSPGLFGLGTLSLLFFVGQAIHSPRIIRRMVHMEREQHSEYEGDALPFFALFPFGRSFWIVRIAWEPVTVAVLAVALRATAIIDGPAMAYLVVAALFLCVRNYLAWYQHWLYIRILMDGKFAAPLLAKAASGSATDNELAQVHMAGFQARVPADVRTAVIAQMAPPMPSLPPELAQLISAVEPEGRAA